MNETPKETTTALVEAPPQSRQLPEPVQRRGITEAQWLTLTNTLFPGAATASVILVWDYCAARKLDPMKKPVHIVPMRIKDSRTDQWGWRDVVMPGIYEYRITAHRTGLYLGHTEPEYGPPIKHLEVEAFEWCAMTFYRWNEKANAKVPFPVKVYFREVVATTKKNDVVSVNDRWTRAAIQMLTKCTEAAGLRETFPEEFGGEPTAEEMEGRTITPQTTDIPGTAVTALDRIPEGMRDNIERAFAELGLTPAQRLTRANEFLGGDGVDPEDGAAKLLTWCRDEFTKRKAAPPARNERADGNGKAAKEKAPESAGSAPAAPPVGTAASPHPPVVEGEVAKPVEPTKTVAKDDEALF